MLNVITRHKKGHKRAECQAKGGGKEGQGPRAKAKKGKEEPKKKMASDVVEEGVWMAVASDSGDEHMVDNEFDDFIISDDDLSIFEEELNEEAI